MAGGVRIDRARTETTRGRMSEEVRGQLYRTAEATKLPGNLMADKAPYV